MRAIYIHCPLNRTMIEINRCSSLNSVRKCGHKLCQSARDMALREKKRMNSTHGG